MTDTIDRTPKTSFLRDEHRKLVAIVEAMDNLVIILDAETRVQWVNPAFVRQTGWTLDEIIGSDPRDRLRCPESDPAVIAEVNLAVAERRPFKGEMINTDRQGNRYWVDFNILPLLGPDGRLEGYVSVETVVTKLHQQHEAIGKLAQAAALAQRQLENALMVLPDGVMILDGDDQVLVVNEAYRQAFPEIADIAVPGSSLACLLRAGLQRGIFGAAADEAEAEVRLATRLAQFRMPKFIDEVRTHDGRWMRRISLRTADGGCIYVELDVTTRHQQLDAVNAANQDLTVALAERDTARERLVSIMDGAEVGTWELDVASDVLRVGGCWGEIIGLETRTLGDLGSADFRAHVHAADLQLLDAQREKDMARGEETIEDEFRMRHRDGHWVWVLSRSRVTHRGPDGAPLALVGIHFDISDRKRLEQDLHASRAYLSKIMDMSVAAIAVLDSSGVLTFANREAEAVLGLQRSAIVGRTYDDPKWGMERVEGGVLPPEEAPFNRALAAGGAVRDVRVVLHRSDGAKRVLSCNAAPLAIGDQGVQVVVSFTDITDTIEATARLEEARNQAEEMSRAKSVFLANMSHEIRTPLNGVLGMAEVLAATVTEPEQKRMISTIRGSGETLLNVLNGILDMSKIEAGKMELEVLPFSPSEMVRQLDEIFAVQAEERGIAFTVLSSAGSERLRLGDRHRIQQILNNLLNNAIKFTPHGSVTLRVSCRAGKPVVIEVLDTGIGMDAIQASRVFDSFQQADGSTTRRFGGTGLGLSIVRQLVRLMDGEIALDSTPGEGTRVRVTLPLPETPAEARGAPVPAVEQDVRDSALRDIRLLCADDNAVNRMVLREMLLPTGALITEVENGMEAVQAWLKAQAEETPFDLLLLDITMPVLDGMGALAAIRASEARRGLAPVPAIAVTASAMSHQVAEYIVGGFDTHLAKPFGKRDLLHALHSLLRRQPGDSNS